MATPGICSTCHSLEMGRGDDGFWYCRVCGAQSQNFLEEAFDHDDAHLFNLRHIREKNVARGEDMMMTGILASQQQQQQQQERKPQQQKQQQQQQQQQSLGLFSSQNFSQENLGFLGDFSSQFGVLSQFASQAGAAEIEPTGGVFTESLVAHTLNSQLGLSQADKLSSKIRSVYVEGVQILLQLQCEALVQKFGVNPLVCGITGPVWMRFVASTCVFEKGWANEALLVAETRALKYKKTLQSGISERTEGKEFKLKRRQRKRDPAELWTSYGERAQYVWLRSLKGRIPLRATLGILFLVCHIARESILPMDLKKWALDGSLPYLAAHTEISKRLEWPAHQSLPLSSKLMFKPKNISSARTIEHLTSVIAHEIKIELPPVNFHAIAVRFLKELDLPVQKLGFYICRLFEWYPISGLWLSSQESCFPTRVYVMAMLVVTFKIVYKLDGRDRKKKKSTMPHSKGLKGTVASSSKEGSNMRDLQENDRSWDSKEFVAKLENRVCGDRKLPDDQEELMGYLKYYRDVISVDETLTTDEEHMQDNFRELYNKASQKDASIKCSRRRNLKVERTDAEQEGSKALREESPSTCTNNSPQSQASLHQNLNDTSFQLGSHLESNRKVLSKAKSLQQSNSKDKQKSSVENTSTQELENLGFSILNPVKKTPLNNEYLRYSISRGGNRYVHREYVIVLQVCAKFIDVDPRVLHSAVQNVEKGLVKSEKGIEHFLASLEREASDDEMPSVEPMEEDLVVDDDAIQLV